MPPGNATLRRIAHMERGQRMLADVGTLLCEVVMPVTSRSSLLDASADHPPFFWLVAVVAGMEKSKADLALRNSIRPEEIKIYGEVALSQYSRSLADHRRTGGLHLLSLAAHLLSDRTIIAI